VTTQFGYHIIKLLRAHPGFKGSPFDKGPAPPYQETILTQQELRNLAPKEYLAKS